MDPFRAAPVGAAGRSARNRRAALAPFQPLRAPAGGAARSWEVSPGLVLDAAVQLGCRAATGGPPLPARLGRPLLPEQSRCLEKSAAGDAISGPTLSRPRKSQSPPWVQLWKPQVAAASGGSADLRGEAIFWEEFAVISTRGLITMLRILVILPPHPHPLTLGAFLNFPWRADKGKRKVMQNVCLGCQLKWGLSLALSLTCSVIARKQYSPRLHSSHFKKCREGIKADHIKDWWGCGEMHSLDLPLSSKTENIHALCPDDSLSWFLPWRNTCTCIQEGCPLQDHT